MLHNLFKILSIVFSFFLFIPNLQSASIITFYEITANHQELNGNSISKHGNFNNFINTPYCSHHYFFYTQFLFHLPKEIFYRLSISIKFQYFDSIIITFNFYICKENIIFTVTAFFKTNHSFLFIPVILISL